MLQVACPLVSLKYVLVHTLAFCEQKVQNRTLKIETNGFVTTEKSAHGVMFTTKQLTQRFFNPHKIPW